MKESSAGAGGSSTKMGEEKHSPKGAFPWVAPVPLHVRIPHGFLMAVLVFHFCRFIGSYDDFVAMKLRAIRAGQDPAPSWGGRGGWKSGQLVGDTNAGERSHSPAPTPEAPTVSSASRETPSPTRQMQPESSPWTFREKLGRAAWMIFGRPLTRHISQLVRHPPLDSEAVWGQSCPGGIHTTRAAHIEVPWMIDLREGVTIGDYAILYSLGPITIGERSIISQYALVCRHPRLRGPHFQVDSYSDSY